MYYSGNLGNGNKSDNEDSLHLNAAREKSGGEKREKKESVGSHFEGAEKEGRKEAQTNSGSLKPQLRVFVKRTVVHGRSKAVSKEVDFSVPRSYRNGVEGSSVRTHHHGSSVQGHHRGRVSGWDFQKRGLGET